jgi:hypothetical protein
MVATIIVEGKEVVDVDVDGRALGVNGSSNIWQRTQKGKKTEVATAEKAVQAVLWLCLPFWGLSPALPCSLNPSSMEDRKKTFRQFKSDN